MKKLLYVLLLLLTASFPLLAQTNLIGSKDCSTAYLLCENDSIVDKLVGATNRKGLTDDIKINTTCFQTKKEFNPFWYQFTADNSGAFEMYLNAKQEGIDFDFIVFDITNGCANKTPISCNQSQLDLDSNFIGTGIDSDSAVYYENDFPGTENSWNSDFNLVTGKKYAIYIESRQLKSSDSAFTITFGGTAQFRNVVADFSINPSQCFGKPVTFTNSSIGAKFYDWDFGDGSAPVYDIVNPTHNYTLPGTYNVKLVSKTAKTGGCTDTIVSSITINVQFNPFAGNDVSICSGSSVTLKATGGVTYNWSSPANPSLSTTNTYIASPSSSTVYTVTATDINGCIGTDNVVVTVNPLTPVNAGSDVAVCTGSSTTLNATGTGTFVWSPATNLSSTSIANPVATPTATTTYTVTLTDSKGCKNTDDIIVSVNPLPVVSAGSNATICKGTSTTLAASGAATYVWSPATGLSSTTLANPVAAPAVTTTYTVTGMDAKGCKNTSLVTVTVTTLPAVDAGPDVAICAGQSTTLKGMGGTTYAWSPATGLSSTSIANPVASPAVTTTYTVTVTDATGCTGTDNVTITVNPLPVVNAGSDVAVCTGSSTILNATGTGTFVWLPATNLSSTSIANPLASPTATTTYIVTLTDSKGCKNTDDVIVSVNPLPVVSAGSNATICKGTSTTLAASGAATYVWSSATGLSSTTLANPVAAPAVTTTYTVTGMDAKGCKNTSLVTVTVTTLPAVDAGPDVAICAGQTTTLKGTGGTTYAWSPATGLSSTSIASPVASPAVTTTYTVTVTDATGCTGTDNVTVTVNLLPAVNAGSDVAVCTGSSTILNATGTGTFVWLPATNLSSTSIANPLASPTATTTYIVTLTDSKGCKNTDDVIVSVNPLPVVSAGSNATICKGTSTALTASGAVTYTWSPATGLSSATIANPVAAPVATTTYTVTGVDAKGCKNTSSVTVTVTTLPAVDAGPDVAICAGQSTTLKGTGGTTYAWSPAAGLSSTSIANPVASPTTTQKYFAIIKDATGCAGLDSVTVTVNPLPSVNAGSDVAVCAGSSTTLNATGTGTFVWSPATNLTSTSIANPVATPTATTTYTVTLTDSKGCKNTDDVIVSVNPLPVVSAGSNATICKGTSTTLTASGAVTYTWLPATGLSSATLANPVAAPTVTTTYTVTGMDAKGCKNTSSVTVTVTTLPAVDAGPDVAICAGQSTTLKGSGGTTYAWSPATGLSSTSIANPVASPTTTQKYFAIIKDATGCAGLDSVTVTVNPLPSVNAGSDVAVCAGSSASLNATGTGTFVWSPATNLSSTTIANPVATPGATTTYIVTLIDSKGCKNTDDVVVAVNPLPVVSAGSNATICKGTSTTLAASGASTYVWSPATGLSSSTIANPVAAPTATTTYTVTGVDAKGCKNTSSVTVSVTTLPAVDAGPDVAICAGQSTTLKGTGGTTYSWSPATGLSSTSIASPVASPAVTMTYTVTVTDATGCTGTDNVTITVNPLPAVNAGSDAAVCLGSSTTLNATGTGTFGWSPATNLSSTTIANPVATPTATTTYTVTLTDSKGCKNTDDIIVSVNPLPVVSAGSNTTICKGTSTTLTASGAVTYTWSPATGLSSATIANPVAVAAATTTYTVTGVDAKGCKNTSSVTVTVTTLPAVDAGPDVAICSGQSTTLKGIGGTTYTWSPATGLSSTSIANPIASPTTTQKYFAIIKDATGCAGLDSVTVMVNPLPAVNAGSDAAVCTGSATTLNATGTGTFAWSPATNLSSTSIANPVASPTATTTYTVTLTDSKGCKNTDDIIVSVNPLPAVSAGSNATICKGTSTSLAASGASTYVWSPATGLSSATSPNPIASPLSTTTYTVTGTDVNKCVNSSTVTINVSPLPNVDAGTDVAICAGQSTMLKGTGGTTYAWSPATGLSSTSIANPIASPTTTQKYFAIIKDATGCAGLDSVTVTVNPLPAVNAGSDAAVCAGSSTTLNATGTGTFVWSPATNLSSTTIANPVATPGATTTYTVTLTDSKGCKNTDDVIVSVNPLPTVSAGTNATICMGTSTSLAASGASTYVWSPATGLSSSTIANPVAAPTATTTYTVTGVDAKGCKNTSSVTVSVTTLPAVDAGPDVAICAGQSTTLKGTGGTTYSWSPATGLSSTSIASPVASPAVTMTYTVTVTDATGCTGTDNVTITVNPLPAVNAGSDAAVCLGSSTTLNATGTGTFGWSPATNLSSTSIANPVASPTATTTYTVTLTDSKGCKNTDNVIVAVNPLPAVSAGSNATICMGTSTSLSASGAVTYTWSPATGLSSATSPNPIASPLSTTTYTLTGTDVNKCVNSSTVTINVSPLPNVDAGADVAICAGQSTTLKGTGGTTYAWSHATGLSSTSIANPIASPTTTQKYFAIIKDATGCAGLDSVTVTVNPLPSVNAGSDAAVCAESATSLNATGTGTFAWSPATGLSSTTIANPVASPTATTTYTVTLTDSKGCKNTDDVIVSVNPLPTVSAGTNATICMGTSTSLSASGAASYVWTPSTGLSSATSPNPIASPLFTTTYTVTGVDAKGCKNNSSVTVTVTTLPAVDAGTDVAICAGQSTMLKGSGGTTYAWSPATGLSSTSIANPVASPTTTQKYFAIIKDATGCAGLDSVTVTVNPLPSVNAGSDAAVCTGSSASLNASGTGTFVWSPATNLSSTTIANPVAAPTATTTYTITLTDSKGCKNTDNVIVAVNIKPIADAGSDVTLCKGQIASFNGSGGNQFTWTPSTGLSSTNIANPTANPDTTITYQVKVTDSNGCSDIDSLTINVNSLPIANAGKDTTFCAGRSAMLKATGGVQYLWSPAISLSDATINNPVTTPLKNLQYVVKVTDNNNCSNNDTININVTYLNITVSNNDTICEGDTSVIKASGGLTYSWSPATGLSNPNIASPFAFPATTTLYTVFAGDVNGCVNTAEVIVSVNQNPLLDAGPDLSFCYGKNVAMAPSGTGTFIWFPSTGLSDPSIKNPIASPTSATTYKVKLTDNNGCASEDSLKVDVNYIAINKSKDTSICAGSSTVLSATGGNSYQWTPSLTLTTPGSSTTSATPAVTTTYQVSVTDASGCSNKDSIKVSILALPTVDAGTDQSICFGTSTRLNASGGKKYLWTPSAGLSSDTVNNPDVVPSISQKYTVQATDGLGCSNKDSMMVTVTFIPLKISKDTSICLGKSVPLNISGGTIFEWSPSVGLSDSTSNNPVASPTYKTNYSVLVSDDAGCKNTASVTIGVNAITTSASNDTSLCQGDSYLLDSKGGIQYSWTPANGLSDSKTSNPLARPDTTTNYAVSITDANGCMNLEQVKITVLELPKADAGQDTTVCNGNSIRLSAGSADSYLWTPAKGLSNASIPDPLAAPSVTTDYSLSVTGPNGCIGKDTIRLTVSYINVTISQDTTICKGNSTLLQSTGGKDYRWSPSTGLSDALIPNPLAQPSDTTTYTVLVTDTAGCKNSKQVKLNVNSPIASAGNDVAFCLGKSTSLNATGGVKYVWFPSTGLSDAGIANPIAKPTDSTQYIVTVFDQAGCIAKDTVVVDVNISVSGNASAKPLIFCPGQPITVTASTNNSNTFAFSPYSFDGGITYQKDNTAELKGAKKDTLVKVIIRDENGCLSDTFKINLTKKNLTATTVELNPIGCTGLPEGKGMLSKAAGGKAPYLFSQDSINFLTDSVFSTLTGGPHKLYLKDQEGCSNLFTLNISTASNITATAKAQPLNCFDDTTGTAVIIASGGSGLGFRYSSDSIQFQKSDTITHLVRGFNTIFIKDSLGCTKKLLVNITSPEKLEIEIDATAPTCFNKSDGNIDIAGNGGTLPYTYSLTDTFYKDSSSFSNLKGGNYNVYIKDSIGCKNEIAVLLKSDSIIADIEIAQYPLCSGVKGIIEIKSVKGGATGGYLKWINNEAPGINDTFSGLYPGNYTISVMDSKKCIAAYDMILPGDPNSVSGIKKIDSITCNNSADGIIQLLDAKGGIRPYVFSLNNETDYQGDSIFKNLKKGNYTIFVKNSNLCTSAFNFALDEPTAVDMNLLIIQDASCHGLKDGKIALEGVGGNEGYHYSINNRDSVPSGVFSNLSIGRDTITIIDRKGCNASFAFEIGQPDSLILDVAELSPAHCTTKDGVAKIKLVTGGNGLYSFSLNMDSTFRTDSIFRSLSSGTYTMLVKDRQNCSAKKEFNISKSEGALKVAEIKKEITDLSCNNAEKGAVKLTNMEGGSAPYSYAMDSTLETVAEPIFTGLGGGAHVIKISDQQGCRYELGFTISQTDAINFNLTLIQKESCNNSNGIITISNVTGGKGKYAYHIDNLPTQDSMAFHGLSSGLHTVVVQDGVAGSCKTSKSITVDKKSTPQAFVTKSNPVCFNVYNGFIAIDSVKGGAAPYTFSINDAEYTSKLKFDNLKAGQYILSIKDSECPKPVIYIDSVFIKNKEGKITDTITSSTMALAQSDSITAESFAVDQDKNLKSGLFGIYNIQGGTKPYTYSMDDITYKNVVSDTTLFENVGSGDHFVFLKDSKSCPSKVKVYLGRALFIPNLVTPNHDGSNDYFEILALKNNSALTVFNQWGSRVYSNDDYDNSWDGGDLPDGLYYYELKMNKGKTYKGWVQIIR